MTLYDQSIATFRSRIDTLTALLTKAAAHPKGEALLAAKLSDDMHPLSVQARFVANIPGEALKHLGIASFHSSESEITTYADAKALLTATSELLDSIGPDKMPAPDARIEFAIGGGAYQFAMTSEEYVREFALPNFYFHLSTAYAILRMNGLDIGKADFIPHMFAYLTNQPE